MPGMSLKLVLVWFGVVVGNSDSNPNTNLDAIQDRLNGLFRSSLINYILEDHLWTEIGSFDISGLNNPNTEMPEFQSRLKMKRMAYCLERLDIFRPLLNDQLVECPNPDGSSDWILKLSSVEDRRQILENRRIEAPVDYLDELQETPTQCEVIDKDTDDIPMIDAGACYIHPTNTNPTNTNPTLNSTSTKPNEESITYKQCLEALQPLKKITSPAGILIFGKTLENEILDQLELLLYILRIADSPIIRIGWIDTSKTRFDMKSIDRFRSLLEDVPKKKRQCPIELDLTSLDNRVFWRAFFKLIREHYDIKLGYVDA
ncbi:hypothetical protein NEHOM01_2319 [Nematocida homosporus]|uniref:uncharacterized protein n=1 Tax=Nematocida homosporus TaxID=1912981 RepID=UPI00221E7AD1|nr:uncharacterized protein NEHOM01_2319 [Nematocida homosporus]KAI5187719.1 hypothetical protein NEHOM01_2319 [Nematocida homosporus]